MFKNESKPKNTEFNNILQAERPKPIVENIEMVPYKRRMPPHEALDAILDGYFVLISDFFSSGLGVLNEVKKYLKNKYSDATFQGQRDLRSAYRQLSNQLVLKISNNKLTVRKAPDIGWFGILYPEVKEFLLPFPQVQGLNSSWQWYERGIFIPALKRKIHPWYGTYFPTRFEHIELFDNWLKKYKGEKNTAIDVGIGSGVLSFLMLKHGFKKIIGTDINPNAIIGLREELKRNEQYSGIDLLYGDLFANCMLKTELIVFNPPWLPASYDTEGLDKAVYYDNQLFPQFFAKAKSYLKEDGIIVILFSNLSKVIKTQASHPIEKELKDSTRFQKVLYIEKNVRPASKKTRRNQKWRSSEKIELWVLKVAERPPK